MVNLIILCIFYQKKIISHLGPKKKKKLTYLCVREMLNLFTGTLYFPMFWNRIYKLFQIESEILLKFYTVLNSFINSFREVSTQIPSVWKFLSLRTCHSIYLSVYIENYTSIIKMFVFKNYLWLSTIKNFLDCSVYIIVFSY